MEIIVTFHKRIKLPKTEVAAQIILDSGPAYFPGDGTCVVPQETIQHLKEAGVPFKFILRHPPKPKKGGGNHGRR